MDFKSKRTIKLLKYFKYNYNQRMSLKSLAANLLIFAKLNLDMDIELDHDLSILCTTYIC